MREKNLVRLQPPFAVLSLELIVENRQRGFSPQKKDKKGSSPQMVIVPSKAYSSKLFFFFSPTTVLLFSSVVWQKICPGEEEEDKGSYARRRTKRGPFFFFFFFGWKFSFNYRGVSCLAICVHFPLSSPFLPLPSLPLFRGSKLILSSPPISSFFSRFLGIIELFERVNLLPLNEIRTSPPRKPRVHACVRNYEAQTVSRQRKYTRCREGISIRSGRRKF